MNCALCGKEMVEYMDTFLCPDCGYEQLYELAAFVKYDVCNIDNMRLYKHGNKK